MNSAGGNGERRTGSRAASAFAGRASAVLRAQRIVCATRWPAVLRLAGNAEPAPTVQVAAQTPFPVSRFVFPPSFLPA